MTGSEISKMVCLDIECGAILLAIECSIILSDVCDVCKGEVRQSCYTKVHCAATLSSAGGEYAISESIGTVSGECC